VSEKLDQKKRLEAFVLRVWSLSKRKEPVVVRLNNEKVFECDVGKLLTLGNGKLSIDLGQLGLKTKGDLIGMAGFFYNPKIFWGETVENVARSWDWVLERISPDAEHFKTILEAEAILEFLSSGVEEGLLFYLFSLVVDLHELDSLDVDVSPKISELRSQTKGHLRKYEKLRQKNKVQSLVGIGHLRRYMADLSSECRLARLSKEYGYEVRLGKHPDLTVNDTGIEAKRVRGKPLLHEADHVSVSDLSNAIKRGVRQRADVIAIQVSSLQKRKVKDFRTVWTGSDTLRNALKTALAFKNEGRCVLLFCGTNKGYFGRVVLLK